MPVEKRQTSRQSTHERGEQRSAGRWGLRTPGRKATSTQVPETWRPKEESAVANGEWFPECKLQRRGLRQSLPQASTTLWRWGFLASAAVDKSHAISRSTHALDGDRTRDSPASRHTAAVCKTASEGRAKQRRGRSAPDRKSTRLNS